MTQLVRVNRQLTVVHSSFIKDQIDKVVELDKLPIIDGRVKHPTFGVLMNDNIYLILSDDKALENWLIKINFNDFSNVSQIPLDTANYLINPIVHENHLYISDYFQSAVYKFYENKKRIRAIGSRLSRNNLYSTAFFGQHLYAATGETIIKTSLQEGIVFVAIDKVEGPVGGHVGEV